MTRFPDAWLNAIFFLGTKAGATITYRGTGFAVSSPHPADAAVRIIALVTARHNIENARKAGQLWIRMNTVDEGSTAFEVDPFDDWSFHRDETVDLAAMVNYPTHAPWDRIAGSPIAVEGILGTHEVEVFDVGPGSDVMTVGLFSGRTGAARNIPVIRTGIVAAMPGEPIDDGSGHGPYTGYLLEMLSMGGLSGSPVFHKPIAGTEFPRVSYYLVGVVRSHWDERPAAEWAELSRSEWLNRGMAAATPATEIPALLASLGS